MQPQPFLRPLLIAVALTVVIRALALLVAAGAFESDPDAYRAIAKTISQSGIFGLTSPEGLPRAVAFRPPLYPWLVSFCMSEGGLSTRALGVLHLVLAGLTTCAVFLSTRDFARLISSRISAQASNRLGFCASILTAVDPILLRQSTEVMTETLAAALTAAVIWLWGRWTPGRSSGDQAPWDTQVIWNTLLIPAALGVLLALAYLCRPTFVVWSALLVVAAFARSRDWRGCIAATMIALLVAVTVAAWTLRNVRAVGHPVWATTHGGYTLLLANNESFYQYLREGRFGQAWNAEPFLTAYQHRYEGDPTEASFWQREWSEPPSYEAAGSEYDDDRLSYESAVATIKRQPKMFVWSAVVRVARLWSPFPHEVAGRSTAAIWMVSGFYLVIYIALGVTVIRNWRRVFASQWWAIWLLAITLTGVHAVYWSNLRMRSPAMPAIAMLAVLCVVRDKREEGR